MAEFRPYEVDRLQQYVDACLGCLRMDDCELFVDAKPLEGGVYRELKAYGPGSRWFDLSFHRDLFIKPVRVQKLIFAELLADVHFQPQKYAALDLETFLRPMEWDFWKCQYERLHDVAVERLAQILIELLPEVPVFFGPGFKLPPDPAFPIAQEPKLAPTRLPVPEKELPESVGEKLGSYIVQDCMPALGMFDFSLCLRAEMCDDKANAAIQPLRGRQHTALQVGASFFTRGWREMRKTVAHELLHLLFSQELVFVEHAGIKYLSKHENSLYYGHYNQVHEVSVDRLSTALSQLLPVPPDFLEIPEPQGVTP